MIVDQDHCITCAQHLSDAIDSCAKSPSSKWNGFVTSPTVRAPAFRAVSATNGATAPPVPPPIPASKNTISMSLRTERNSREAYCPNFLPNSELVQLSASGGMESLE